MYTEYLLERQITFPRCTLFLKSRPNYHEVKTEREVINCDQNELLSQPLQKQLK